MGNPWVDLVQTNPTQTMGWVGLGWVEGSHGLGWVGKSQPIATSSMHQPLRSIVKFTCDLSLGVPKGFALK